jgi:hypothetical protein
VLRLLSLLLCLRPLMLRACLRMLACTELLLL